MANGTYGTRKPAQITADDVDIFYHYRPSYSSDAPNFADFKKLDSSILLACNAEYEIDGMLQTFELPGMYNLRLPLDKFGSKGIYTIYIKPKEIFTKIVDVSTLAAYSNVRGIVLDSTTIQNSDIMNNGNLVGYRVEYFCDDGKTRNGEYRIITSNNRCEPVAQNFNDSSQKGIRYRYNDSSNLIFCTLSPSASLSYKSNSIPNIGVTNQTISLVNSKFNPVALEIEMVEHDAETISTMLEGTQVRNLDNGLITTFNKDGGIYHQADYGNITNPSTGINHDFKLPRKSNIIFNEEERLREIEENI